VHLIAGSESWAGRHVSAALRARERVRELAWGTPIGRSLRGVGVIHYVAQRRSALGSRKPDAVPDPWLAELLGAAREQHVKRVVYLSSSRVYGPQIPHGPGARIDESTLIRPRHENEHGLAAEEQWLRAQPDLEVVVVRLAQVLDAEEPVVAAFSDRLGRGDLWLPGGGRAARTFLAGTDVGHLALAAADRGRAGAIHLAGGFRSSWLEVGGRIAPEARIRGLPYDLSRLLAGWHRLQADAGADHWSGAEMVDLLARPQVLDDARTRRDLVWSPLVTTAEEWVADSTPAPRPRRRGKKAG